MATLVVVVVVARRAIVVVEAPAAATTVAKRRGGCAAQGSAGVAAWLFEGPSQIVSNMYFLSPADLG